MCLHDFLAMYLVWILALCLAITSEATKDKNEIDKIEAIKIDARPQTLTKLKKLASKGNGQNNKQGRGIARRRTTVIFRSMIYMPTIIVSSSDHAPADNALMHPPHAMPQ